MAMIVPPIDESAPIRREAQGLVGVFRAMARTAETIKSSWKGLAALYSAPEEETVHSAMVKPDNYARTVKRHAETAYVALCNYADRLDKLRVVRNQLVADIAAHEAKLAEAKDKVSEKVIAHDKHGLPVKMKDNAVDSALVDEGEALHDRLTQFVTDLEDAQRECGNKLNATWGGAQFVQADKTDVNNPNVYGTSNDSKRDQTRTGQAPWGFPEVWQRANMGASGKLALGGAWNSFAGSFKDLADLMGVGGDEGATNHKRSALLKLKEYIETYAKNTSWTAPYTRSVSPEEQKRYEEACKALGESLKGMVSYDTWGTDPHGTAGGFLPDALSIATGGGAGKLDLKMLGKLSPKLAMNLTALRQVFRLKNLGNWTRDALELLRTIGKNTPEGMAQRELKQFQEIVDGNIPIADKAVDGSDTPRTAPLKGPGPIESGFNRSGSGAGTHLNNTGVGGSRPGGGSGAGAGGHQLDGSGRGASSRHGAGSGHWNGGHPQRSGEHGWSVPREGAEHHAPRRGDGGHSHGSEERVGDSARRGTSGVGEDAAPRRALDGEDARGQHHTPGDGNGHDAGRSGGPGDSSPEVPGDESPRPKRADDGPRFAENGRELYGDDGKPLVHDRGDGRMHYASDPEGTYRSLENGRWKLKNLDDGKYAGDLYAGGDKDVNYPASKPSYGSHEWRDPALGELSKADKEAWDAIRDEARRDRELANEAVKQAEKLGVKDAASKSYRQIAEEMEEFSSDKAREVRDILNKATDSSSLLRGASEWVGDRAGFLRNEDLERETIIGKPGDSPGGHGSPGPGKFDQVAIEGDNRIYFEENKGGDGVKLGARDVEAGGRAQQGSLPYLEDLVTGGRQDPRILETLKKMKADGKHEAFFKNLAEGKVEVRYEIVNARTNGAVRVGEFDLGGRVRIKWDGKGDIEVIKE